MSRRKIFAVALVAALCVAVLSALPAFAEDASVPQAAPAAPSSTGFSNCGGSLDLNNLTVQGEICPATPPAPELMAKPPRLRYCTCGCGATCTTDADCDGGRCVSVITCC